jgi:hypothetical protein
MQIPLIFAHRKVRVAQPKWNRQTFGVTHYTNFKNWFMCSPRVRSKSVAFGKEKFGGHSFSVVAAELFQVQNQVIQTLPF